MYNEPQKQAYINHYIQMSNGRDKDARRTSLNKFFERLGLVELDIGKDFSMLNYAEIKTVLAIVCRRSVKYQKSILSELRSYMEWCIDNGMSVDCENRLIGIAPKDIDIVDSYRACMLKNEEELNSAINSTLKQKEDSTLDNRTRAIVHLLFAGVPYNDIFTLKKGQVDIKEKKISLNGRSILMSGMCSEIVAGVMNMEDFVSGRRKYEIVNTGHVIENSNGSRDSISLSQGQIVSDLFSQIKESKGEAISITASDILLSGIFYRMFEKEKTTGQVDFDEYLLLTGGAVTEWKNVSSEINDGEVLYTSWKAAFNLNMQN